MNPKKRAVTGRIQSVLLRNGRRYKNRQKAPPSMNMNRLSLSVRAALLATAASLVMPAMAEVAPPPVAVTAVTAVTAAATVDQPVGDDEDTPGDRKSTRLNSSH